MDQIAKRLLTTKRDGEARPDEIERRFCPGDGRHVSLFLRPKTARVRTSIRLKQDGAARSRGKRHAGQGRSAVGGHVRRHQLSTWRVLVPVAAALASQPAPESLPSF